MPELPEVETVARLVRPKLVGRAIEGVEVAWTRSLGGVSRAAFARAVVGARVRAVGRRAKFVRIDLEREGRPAGALLVHLRLDCRRCPSCPRSRPSSGNWSQRSKATGSTN